MLARPTPSTVLTQQPLTDQAAWAEFISKRAPLAVLIQRSDAQQSAVLDAAEILTSQMNLHHVVAMELAARGLRDTQTIDKFRGYSALSIHAEISGLAEARQCLQQLKANHGEVLVVHDFDADGVCSAAIMAATLNRLGIKYSMLSPDRKSEGYGFSLAFSERALIRPQQMLIALDFGTNSQAAVAQFLNANKLVWIIDHHEISDASLLGNAFTNHHQSECGLHGQAPCTAGSCYSIAMQLLEDSISELQRADIEALAAIATIADVVPFSAYNHALAAKGLEALKIANRANLSIGLRSLIEQLEIRGEINADDIGFRIGPVLNAASRMLEHGADLAFELLTTKDQERAYFLANYLVQVNRERQELDRRCLSQAHTRLINSDISSGCIFVELAEEAHTVAGIVAARLADDLNRPVFVFTPDACGNLRFSARNMRYLRGVSENEHAALGLAQLQSAAGDALAQGGGHWGASGGAVRATDLDSFKDRVNKRFNALTSRADFSAFVACNQEIRLKPLLKDSFQIFSQLALLEPTMRSVNPPTQFLLRDVVIVGVEQDRDRPERKRVILRQADSYAAVRFWGRLGELSLSEGMHLDVAVSLVQAPYRKRREDLVLLASAVTMR